MTRGQVRCLRRGLRCFCFVMSALTWVRMANVWSRGKGRVSDPAAQDADGAPELDAVRKQQAGLHPVGFKYSATRLTCGWAGNLPGGYAAGSYWLIKPPRI
jgi:hypothetical protein